MLNVELKMGSLFLFSLDLWCGAVKDPSSDYIWHFGCLSLHCLTTPFQPRTTC